ncbi:hypothetical protein C7M84_001529 [Penaeus vannamei]|uniref:Uncharacterized protein n=1 Tax=Penaeus vannamei TaxID=6689 RepID=A0A423TTH5_PENVA|nr:hypothetical protein C7M84_001529 [Penaeus vannamei]
MLYSSFLPLSIRPSRIDLRQFRHPPLSVVSHCFPLLILSLFLTTPRSLRTTLCSTSAHVVTSSSHLASSPLPFSLSFTPSLSLPSLVHPYPHLIFSFLYSHLSLSTRSPMFTLSPLSHLCSLYSLTRFTSSALTLCLHSLLTRFRCPTRLFTLALSVTSHSSVTSLSLSLFPLALPSSPVLLLSLLLTRFLSRLFSAYTSHLVCTPLSTAHVNSHSLSVTLLVLLSCSFTSSPLPLALLLLCSPLASNSLCHSLPLALLAPSSPTLLLPLFSYTSLPFSLLRFLSPYFLLTSPFLPVLLEFFLLRFFSSLFPLRSLFLSLLLAPFLSYHLPLPFLSSLFPFAFLYFTSCPLSPPFHSHFVPSPFLPSLSLPTYPLSVLLVSLLLTSRFPLSASSPYLPLTLSTSLALLFTLLTTLSLPSLLPSLLCFTSVSSTSLLPHLSVLSFFPYSLSFSLPLAHTFTRSSLPLLHSLPPLPLSLPLPLSTHILIPLLTYLSLHIFASLPTSLSPHHHSPLSLSLFLTLLSFVSHSRSLTLVLLLTTLTLCYISTHPSLLIFTGLKLAPLTLLNPTSPHLSFALVISLSSLYLALSPFLYLFRFLFSLTFTFLSALSPCSPSLSLLSPYPSHSPFHFLSPFLPLPLPILSLLFPFLFLSLPFISFPSAYFQFTPACHIFPPSP